MGDFLLRHFSNFCVAHPLRGIRSVSPNTTSACAATYKAVADLGGGSPRVARNPPFVCSRVK